MTAQVARAGSRLTISGDGAKNGKGDGYTVKRPCWYEPFLNAQEMIDLHTKGVGNARRAAIHEESHRAFIAPFLEKEGQEGLWWATNYMLNDPAGAACAAALEQFLFVPPNTTPPAGITLQQLAEIARAAMTVPQHTINLNPDAKSFVNLPTWVWIEGIGQPRRTVTASIPGFMSVTVVATLQDIKIDPGTTAERAEIHVEGCGPTGKPYVKGGQFTCGVRYLRSSIDQGQEKYPLTVTTVWPVQVVDNVVPVTFPPVEVDTSRDVQVGEIQSNVRP
ncbi:hypothetical protein [Nonomuraea jiangxiensis]|uniref:hypothetical protein n=1 Tax=Nonomuraea jiangxiensis TaxID=633440 RepID=UPI001FE8843C|nr:hypothetical protein [Nonomuraea jiangxiensis]